MKKMKMTSLPEELLQHIKTYVYTLTDENIRDVVKEYLSGDKVKIVLQYGEISYWDVSRVTNMSKLFFKVNGAAMFNEPLNWNVSKVTNMSCMFGFASNFNQPLDKWDVSNVTTMSGMFRGATSFNQSLNDWDVSNVTVMSFMFCNALSFNQPLNEWDVSNMSKTKMCCMFQSATSFDHENAPWYPWYDDVWYAD